MRILRLTAFLLVTLLLGVGVLPLLFCRQESRLRRGSLLMHAWAKRVLWIFSIEVSRMSEKMNLDTGPGRVIAANHVSYLDIAVILAEAPCLFLAKREVSQWPLLGVLAKACGIVFVDRSSLGDRAQVLRRLRALVNQGHRVVIFPEGTTSLTGPRRGWVNFFPGVFGLARRTSSDLELRYIDYADEDECAWIGDASFVGHLWGFAALGRTQVRVRQKRIEPSRSRTEQCRAYHGARNWYLEGGRTLTHFS